MAQLPEWSPVAAVTPPASEGRGRIVAVVATETATTQGWAAEAAVDVARSWSASGRRVILVDAALEAPSLHGAVGLPNREGLSDAVLYGASVARVSRPVEDGGFFLVTTGTPVADTSAVVKSARWHRLAEGMTEADVLVLLYLRAADSGASAFLGSASDIVLLGGPGDGAPAAIQDLLPLVRAVTGTTDGPSARVAARVGAKSARSAAVAEPVASAAEPVADISGAAAVGTGGDSTASPLVGDGGMGKVILLIAAALLSAVGLGFVLTMVL